MRKIIFTVLLFSLVSALNFSALATEDANINGYVLLPNKDTVKCRFSTRSLRMYSPFYVIKGVMENGEEQDFRAKDKKILGFGFKDLGIQYDFWYIEMKQKSESGFYQQLVYSPKYRLYSRVVGSNTGSSINYVVYNPAGAFAQFESCILCPWKKQLRELLKDDAKALELLETSADRNKIPEFVAAINKLVS